VGTEAPVVDALSARELEASRSRRLGVVILLTAAVACGVFIRQDWVKYAVAWAYSLAVMTPVSYFALRKYTYNCVHAVSDHPARFARVHPEPLLGLRRTLNSESLGFWMSVAFVPTYFVPWVIWTVAAGGTAEFDLPVLLGCLVGLGVAGVCDSEVWSRLGRSETVIRTGVSPPDIMTRRGYRWTWYWGWTRVQTDPHGKD
jgi:hypothetical protein